MKRIFTIIALAATLLASCNNSGIGMYQSIVNEEKIVDNSLENALSPTGVVVSGNDVYVAAKTFYTRNFAGTADWAAVSGAPGFVGSMATIGTDAYFIYYDASGSNPKFGSFDATTETFDLTSTAADYGGGILVDLDAAGTYVFLLVDNGGTKEIHTYDGAAFAGPLGNTTLGLTGTRIDVASSGAEYMVTDGGKFGQIDDPPATFTDSGNKSIIDLIYSTVGTYYLVVDNGGNLFSSADGTSLTDLAKTAPNALSLAELDGFVFAGTTGGYLESADALNFTGPSATSDDQYANSSLEDSSITGFAFDATLDTTFAFTVGNGLWSKEFTAGRWDQE